MHTSTHTLTTAQVNGLRADLSQQLARLRQSVGAHESEDSLAYPDSSAVDANMKDQRQQRLAVISAALERLDRGAYGECASCSNPIPYGRLAVMPETTLCIVCGAR